MHIRNKTNTFLEACSSEKSLENLTLTGHIDGKRQRKENNAVEEVKTVGSKEKF